MSLFWKIFPHLRHWRGHGIHSPFVYALVRNAFVNKRLADSDNILYNELVKKGVGKKTARQLQNTHTFCSYEIASIHDGTDKSESSDFVVIPVNYSISELENLIKKPDLTLAILRPNKKLTQWGDSLAEAGSRLTIDTKRFYLIFNQEQLPKQHFKL